MRKLNMIFNFVTIVHLLITINNNAYANDYEKHYYGYSVIQVQPIDDAQLKFLDELSQNSSNYYRSTIDFWKHPSQVNATTDIMVSPEIKPEIVNLLHSADLHPEVLIHDVGSEIQKQKYYTELRARAKLRAETRQDFLNLFDDSVKNVIDSTYGDIFDTNLDINNNISRNRFENSYRFNKWSNWNKIQVTEFFSDYHSLDEIHKFLDYLAQYDPEYITTLSIGKSCANRDQKIIRIGNSTDKPIVWLDAGTHANEWLGISTVLYMAYQLAEASKSCHSNNSNCPKDIKKLIDTFDWHILPVLNPDGYEYTRTTDRLWRKTRSKNDETCKCPGVDPNRNYPIGFGGEGTSNDKCSMWYHGPKAFSEPETRNQMKYILKFTNKSTNISRIKFFVTIHTYSQLMLLPWAYSKTKELPPEFDDLKYAADEGAKALFAVYHTKFAVGETSQLWGVESGIAADWAFIVPKIKYSYSFELRDKGKYGFLMPAKYIIPSGIETWNGVKRMTTIVAEEVNKNGGNTIKGSKHKHISG